MRYKLLGTSGLRAFPVGAFVYSGVCGLVA